MIAELSPRTIRRERGVVVQPPAAPRVLKPLSQQVRERLAANAAENAAQVSASHPLLDALHSACSEGDASTIELLVKRGASVVEKDHIMGWSGIHYACNHPAAIAAVLQHGGDANAEDDYHMTALHLAAENGAYEAVRVLSKLNRRRRGSIEYLASKKGHYEICELLQKRWSGAADSDDEGAGDGAEVWKVECIFEFIAQEAGDLGMCVGDIVVLTEALAEKKWWVGYQEKDSQKRKGEFPSNYVQVIPAAAAAAPAANTKKQGGGLRALSAEEVAATKVQASYRGHLVRKRMPPRMPPLQRREHGAATKIQATWRGKQTRKRMLPALGSDRQRQAAPALPTAAEHARQQQAHAESFAMQAAAWEELRYSPTHSSPRTSNGGSQPQLDTTSGGSSPVPHGGQQEQRPPDPSPVPSQPGHAGAGRRGTAEGNNTTNLPHRNSFLRDSCLRDCL